MKKGDVGMANRFSKKYGNKGWAFNYLWIKYAYQHLMLHPYITASRTIFNIIATILNWIWALDIKRPVVNFG